MSEESSTAGQAGEPVRRGEGAEGFPHGSKYPFFLGLGLFFTGVGLSMWLPVLVVGLPIVAYGMWGWSKEYAIDEFESGVIPEQKRQIIGMRSGYIAMILVVGGELIIFAGLFVTWFYLNATREQFFPPVVDLPEPTLVLGGVMTALLIAGSVAIAYARHSITNDNRRGLNLGVGLTFLLGLAFLAVLGVEWSGLMGAGLSWTSGPYGATYYVITGVHAVHMIVGMVLVGFVGYRTWLRGHFSSERYLAVSTTELYWHFLTFVSILILAFVYYPTAV
ncbi:MAG: heme-copper oxidase subunit III [Haloarculaceae archaeon]